MTSVNDVTRPNGVIPPPWTDYTGVKSGCMGITSKRVTDIDRIVAGGIELPVGFVSDSDVIDDAHLRPDEEGRLVSRQLCTESRRYDSLGWFWALVDGMTSTLFCQFLSSCM